MMKTVICSDLEGAIRSVICLPMQSQVAPNELAALIRLLDDPDDGIFRNVSDRLVSIGRYAIPFLEYEWESNVNSGIQGRIEDVIHQIQFEQCKHLLQNWTQRGATDLFEGAAIVSLYQYPELDLEEMSTLVNRVVKDVWIELNDNLTSLEKVRVINHILFKVHGIRSYQNYDSSPYSWHLKDALMDRKGCPSALATLYKIVAQRLQLPVYGIDLPHHFVLCYLDWDRKNILFYINPFGKGAVFGRRELDRFLRSIHIETPVESLKPMSNLMTIERLLRDMIIGYERLNDEQRIAELKELLACLSAPSVNKD